MRADTFKKLLYDAVLRIRGTRMYPCLRELEKSQYFSGGDIQSLQSQFLSRILDIARSKTRFYSDCPPMSSENPLEELSRYPLLEKSDLISRAEEMRVDKACLLPFKKTTGGSTGQPVSVLKDRLSFGAEIAAAWRGLGWAGIRPGQRQVRFWGIPGQRLGVWT